MPTSVEIYGVRETLAQLAQIDPKLRREAQASMRAAAKPLAAQISAAIPASAPLSGMSRGRLAWSARSRAVGVKTGGRRRRDGTFPLVSFVVKDGAAQMGDLASTGTLGANLSARYGTRSRWVWPAAERIAGEAERALLAAVERVQAQVGKGLGSTTTRGG